MISVSKLLCGQKATDERSMIGDLSIYSDAFSASATAAHKARTRSSHLSNFSRNVRDRA
jgi:hypothetical protein